MKQTCFLLTKLMTLYTGKAKPYRPIQLLACNIPRSVIIDKYPKEKNQTSAELYHSAFSHKNSTPGTLLQSIKPFILGKSHDNIINPKQQKRLKRKYIYKVFSPCTDSSSIVFW